MTKLSGRIGLLIVTAILGITAPALALIATQDATETIFGVDSSGSPSTVNSGTGTGKIYKDTNTGVLYEVVSGIVINQSPKKKTTFNNRGVSIRDPGQNRSFTATNDQEVIYRATTSAGFASAGRIALFVPPAN